MKWIEKLVNWFKRYWSAENHQHQNPVAHELSTEEKAEIERYRFDHICGIDEDGKPSMEFAVMNLDSIGWIYGQPEKTYILTDINNLKGKVGIWTLMAAFKGTGKAEWEFLIGYYIMVALRKAWKTGEDEADISQLFYTTLTRVKPDNYNGKTKEIEGTEYAVLDEEDIRALIFRISDVSESEEGYKIRLRYADHD